MTGTPATAWSRSWQTALTDTRAIRQGLRDRDIMFVTNIRNNASERFKGCSTRSLTVRERDSMGDRGWKEAKDHSMRWKVESAISNLKRMFKDHVRSYKKEN